MAAEWRMGGKLCSGCREGVGGTWAEEEEEGLEMSEEEQAGLLSRLGVARAGKGGRVKFNSEFSGFHSW